MTSGGDAGGASGGTDSAADATLVHVAEAKDAAVRIQQAGVGWGERWQAQLSAITAAEAAVPFGRDELGQQLQANYSPAAEALKPGAVQVTDGYAQLSQGINAAVQNVMIIDEAIARGLKVE